MVTRLVSLVVALAFASVQSAAAESAPPAVAAKGKSPYLAVLVWHDVVAGPKEVWFDTPLETFRAQLEAIRRGGFQVIDLEQLRAHLASGAPVPPKPIALTFDDNGHGIYDNAFPLLKKYGYHATVFVHTNFVGTTTSKRHNTWDQLREMQRSGLVTVQSLTANHPPDLRQLSDADVMHEFTLSRHSIQARLGYPPIAIVYPEDNYDQRLARLAAKCGFELGFIEDFGNAGASENLLLIHRYSVLTRFDQALSDVAANR